MLFRSTAAVSKAQEAKGAASDQRQQEAKSAEGKAADKKAAEAKVSTPRTTDTKIVESSTIVSKAAESKPVEAKPAVSRNADTKSTQKAKGESKDGARVAEKPVSDVDSSRAQALLQGDSYVVPLGAFLNQANVKTLQAKVTVAGFKSYSEIQKVAKGEQIRVRAGPFSSREEAERAREQLQAAGMTVGPVTKL